MRRRLKRDFYTRGTLQVAKDLLGKILVKKDEGKGTPRTKSTDLVRGKIVETEAYIGPEDKAAHAYQGKKTDRNEVVFEQGGLVYIYLCYGIHWQLNITTDQEKPECVLIRALEPVNQNNGACTERKRSDGPGKLTDWMGLDKDFYGEDLVKSDRLWLEQGDQIKKDQIVSDQRVGIDYAEQWKEKEWRFYVEGNEYVSTN